MLLAGGGYIQLRDNADLWQAIAHQLSLREEGDVSVKKVFSHLTLGQALECGMTLEDWRRNRAADALATEGLQQHGDWKPLVARLKLRKHMMQKLQLFLVEMIKLRKTLVEGHVRLLGNTSPQTAHVTPIGNTTAAVRTHEPCDPLTSVVPDNVTNNRWTRWVRGTPQRGQD